VTNRTGMIMLALGLAVGSCATAVLKPPSLAPAAPSMPGMSMQPKPKSAGDNDMTAAMNRMMQKIAGGKPTGIQDEDFMVMMVPHHESAVDMAKIELKLGRHPELKALASDIVRSQDKEIGQMQGWLKQWYGKS